MMVNALVMEPQSSAPQTNSSYGNNENIKNCLWVQDGYPKKLIFTDDSGIENTIMSLDGTGTANDLGLPINKPSYGPALWFDTGNSTLQIIDHNGHDSIIENGILQQWRPGNLPALWMQGDKLMLATSDNTDMELADVGTGQLKIFADTKNVDVEDTKKQIEAKVAEITSTIEHMQEGLPHAIICKDHGKVISYSETCPICVEDSFGTLGTCVRQIASILRARTTEGLAENATLKGIDNALALFSPKLIVDTDEDDKVDDDDTPF